MRVVLLTTIIFLLVGCKDIFTTSAFSSFKKSTTDMSTEELSAYIDSTPLSEISSEDLEIAETALKESRIELTADDLENSALVQQYVEETTQLLAINMAQADVEGLITDALSIPEDGEEGTDFITNLLDDTERLDNISEASGFAVDAFKADPDSLSSTELVVGGVGLISEVIKDESKSDVLSSITTSEPEDLEAALGAAVTDSGDPVFTAQEISDIQTASDMLSIAESGIGVDSPMAGLFEGLLI